MKSERMAQDAASASFRRRAAILVALTGTLMLLILFAASVGIESVGLPQVIEAFAGKLRHGFGFRTEADVVVFDLRLPRVLFAAAAGMGLALAGTATQGVLLNPLVSPMILGVSSGAAFGASLAMVLGVDLTGTGRYIIMGNAFVMAMAAMFITYGIAQVKRTSKETIILAGVAVGYIFSGLVAVMQYVAGEEDLRALVFWMMGSLWNARLGLLAAILPVLILVFLVLMKLSWDLNAISAGEDAARSLGVHVDRVRYTALIIGALTTAAVVAFTGVIGFIGLMSPHIARIMIGNDHRYLMPASALVGGIVLLTADTAARTVVWPVETPVGIMTALMGGPFFIYLLWRRGKDFWS
jgi:iron complex transport system permease protein